MTGKLKYKLPIVDAIACNMNLKDINNLKNDPDIEFIAYDSKVFAQLDIVNKSINIDMPRNDNLTGKGVTVAVVDTGLTPHVDLIRPQNRILGFKDFVNHRNTPYDDNGHGTHVAGIIAGNGSASNEKYTGIAPSADLLIVKALDSSGSGNTSDIVSAIQWVIETKDVYNTKILNLSLGTPANNPYDSCPLAQAVEKAIQAGLTVICAAGNSGPSKGTILCPGNAPSGITVGAVDDNKTPEINDDLIASFSSRGPTNDGLKKPDVVAPGVDIMSLSNKSSSGYISLSGTSMATPIVTGACALLYEKYNDLTPKKIKKMIIGCCNNIGFSQNEQGAGIIDLEKLFDEDYNSLSSRKHVDYESHRFDKLFDDNIIIFLILIILLIWDF
ncbi:S8 family peptidase [Clostridium sp. D2Q-14]|nr:S8 family peptidase [Anaeromonas gelatinilytica]